MCYTSFKYYYEKGRITIKNGEVTENIKKKMSKSERRQKIIQILREERKIKSEELAERLDISTSRLSEDIKELCQDGFHIKTKYGYRELEEKDTFEQVYEELNQATIRKFLLQQILCQGTEVRGMTRAELAETFDSIYNRDSERYGLEEKNRKKKVSSNLNRDINEACFKKRKKGKTDYLYPDENLPMLRRMSQDDMMNFCECYKMYAEGSPVRGVDEIYYLMKYLLYGEDCEDEEDDAAQRYHVHGKRNQRNKTALDNLQKILMEPYKFFVLNISYRTNEGHQKKINLSIAYIVYVVDKNRWYLMGEEAKRPVIVPIDAIKKIKRTEEKNLIYHHNKYNTIVKEMLAISVDDPQKIVIRFENQPFIKEKVKMLHQKRIDSSTLCVSEDNLELIYEDSVRGIADMYPFLRQYGSSAIVETPKKTQDAMIESARTIIEKYEEVWGDGLSQ